MAGAGSRPWRRFPEYVVTRRYAVSGTALSLIVGRGSLGTSRRLPTLPVPVWAWPRRCHAFFTPTGTARLAASDREVQVGAMKFRLRWYSVPSLSLLVAGVCSLVLPFVIMSQGRAWGVGLGIVFSVLWVLTMYTGTVEVTPVNVQIIGKYFRPTVVPRGTDLYDALDGRLDHPPGL
jgi:hypothetical protein